MKTKLFFLRLFEIINILSWILLFVFILAFYTKMNDRALIFIIIFLGLALVSRFIVIKLKGKFPSLEEEDY